jgi:hypothetical protein
MKDGVNPDTRRIMEMSIKNCGLILVILTCFLVGMASGGVFEYSEPYEPYYPSGWFDSDNQPFSGSFYPSSWFGQEVEPFYPSGWFNYDNQPFNLSNWLNPEPETTDDSSSLLEPFPPLVMPQPLPLPKEELFGSLTTVSENKKSLISFQKSGFYF